MFTWIDWLVIVAYFAMVASIGVYFSRRNTDFKDFMFGGGDMPWLAVGISLIATSVSANTFLGNGGNLDLGINMINWLASDDALISIQPRPSPDSNLELGQYTLYLILFGFLIFLPLAFVSTAS